MVGSGLHPYLFGSLPVRDVYCVLAGCFLPLNFPVAALRGELLMACLGWQQALGDF